MYIYIYYVFMTILYLSLKVCVTVALLLLLFLSLSLFVVCCLWYCSSGSFDFLVLLLCCELTQSGVVGSGWSFFFVPVLAWRIVLTCWFLIFSFSCFSFAFLFFLLVSHIDIKHECVSVSIFTSISVSVIYLKLMFSSSILTWQESTGKISIWHISYRVFSTSAYASTQSTSHNTGSQ